MTRNWFLILALTAVSATGCGSDHRHVRAKLSPKEFSYILAELDRAQPAQRAAILKKHGATEADLREFVQKYAAYPDLLSNAFDTAQSHAQP